MSISFVLLGHVRFPEDVSRCGDCGALVLDSERHIHVAWHDQLEHRLHAVGAP